MALDPLAIKKKAEEALISALAKEMKDEIKVNPQAAASHKRLAAAISEIAKVIIEEILTNGQVAPGIITAGSPTTQTSTSVGKLT